MKACKFWSNEPSRNLYATNADGTVTGIKGGGVAIDVSAELLGVGFLIGPRVASLMLAGALISYLVLAPTIATFGQHASEPVPPAVWEEDAHLPDDPGLVRNMSPDDLWKKYLRFIGAGAVAAGGIISMLRALPLIIGSITGGLRDLRASRAAGGSVTRRTESDLPMTVVLYGSIALVLIITAVPQLGLGFSLQGIVGALMILLFGFLFVTVSSRLTGEVGSSSNPISGMTIATLLLVCLIFFVLDKRDAAAMLTALTVAAVVCIASSNGGTTSQDLKTGFLVGATPSKQQWAILVGALTSAIAIAGTMLMQNTARTHYTIKNVPTQVLNVPADAPTQTVGRPYYEDTTEYRILHVRKDDLQNPGVPAGRYLVGADNTARYRTDLPIDQKEAVMDNGQKAPERFKAPQPQLFASIIEGILGGKLEWGLIIIGVMITFALELLGVSSLPVAVGMYLPFSSTAPIVVGGMVRLLADRYTARGKSDAENETGPGVLLASGFIAGGTLCGLLISFFNLMPDSFNEALAIAPGMFENWDVDKNVSPKIAGVVTFGILSTFLLYIATRRNLR